MVHWARLSFSAEIAMCRWPVVMYTLFLTMHYSASGLISVCVDGFEVFFVQLRFR